MKIANKPPRLCHELVAETAKGLAGAIYEDLMLNNDYYAEWKGMCPDLTPKEAESRFISMMWPKLIEQARATLAKMLALPGNDQFKDQISEALILDNSLMGRPKSAGFRLH